MEHYISEHIPNTCGCELLADGEKVPVHWISFLVDIHTQEHLITANPQIPIPANARQLEARLSRHGTPIRVVLKPDATALPEPHPHDMELVDPKQIRILLEHLLSHASHLHKSLLEK